MLKTIVITGGTDGIGRGLSLHYPKRGNHVIAISNSAEKGRQLQAGAITSRAPGKFTFLQEDLSSAQENKRIASEITRMTSHLCRVNR